MSVDARADALAALATAGDNPFMRSFPQGAVFTWDHDLRYLAAGGQELTELGLSREMLEGRTIYEVFPPEIVAAIEAPYRAALCGRSSTIDLPFSGRIYSQRLSPVLDRDGTVVAGMGFATDVTGVRASENALRESEERARLSFENAPIGKAIVELDGRWRQVNSAVTRLTGYTEAELLGMTFQDITHPDDLDADLEQLRQLLDGRIDSYQMEKRYFTAAGAVVYVLLAVSLVRNGTGAPQYFIAQIQDITDLKRQQQALEDMVAMLAHDLRSPLMAIAGFAELLTSGWDSFPEPNRLALLRRIEASSDAMERLLENTLTVSAVDAGALQPHPAAVSIDLVVRETVGLLTDAVTSIDLTGLTPLVAWVDRTHLTQIVTNLVTNAVKYGDGHVTITADDLPGAIQLRISDHGPGVPSDFVPHLFDRFTRSDHSRRGTQRGTGLGLYIVRSLVAANHAQVSYSETPGGGATFTLTLPKPTSSPGERVPAMRQLPVALRTGVA